MITQFIYDSLGRPQITGKPNTGQCCMCGSDKGEMGSKDFLKTSFTNWDVLKSPGSQSICYACAACMNTNALRKSSWIATGTELRYLKRGDVAGAIFGTDVRAKDFLPLQIPNAIYITTSYKKHGSFKTRINHMADKLYIQFEETGVLINREEAKKVLSIIELLYSIPECEEQKKQPKSFFTKDEILHGNYAMHRMRAFGIGELTEIETALKPHRGSPQFSLLIYIANKKKSGRRKKEK